MKYCPTTDAFLGEILTNIQLKGARNSPASGDMEEGGGESLCRLLAMFVAEEYAI
jgi:hypothetical protein